MAYRGQCSCCRDSLSYHGGDGVWWSESSGLADCFIREPWLPCLACDGDGFRWPPEGRWRQVVVGRDPDTGEDIIEQRENERERCTVCIYRPGQIPDKHLPWPNNLAQLGGGRSTDNVDATLNALRVIKLLTSGDPT